MCDNLNVAGGVNQLFKRDGGVIGWHGDCDQYDFKYCVDNDLSPDSTPAPGLGAALVLHHHSDLDRYAGGERSYASVGHDRLCNGGLWDNEQKCWNEEECDSGADALKRMSAYEIGIHDVVELHKVAAAYALQDVECICSTMVFMIFPDDVIDDGHFASQLSQLRCVRLKTMLTYRK